MIGIIISSVIVGFIVSVMTIAKIMRAFPDSNCSTKIKSNCCNVEIEK